MKKTHYLIFDVDDTLVNTELAIANIIHQQFGFQCPLNTYLNPGNTNNHHAQVLAEAKFMVDTPLEEGTAELFALLPTLKEAGYKLAICTHRGYHAEGEKHTIAMLERYQVRDYFDDIIILDFNQHPDKVAFLEAYLDENETFTLFDDRPRFDQTHPVDVNVVVVDRPWNQNIQCTHRCYNVFTFVNSMLQTRLARREKLANLPRPREMKYVGGD